MSYITFINGIYTITSIIDNKIYIGKAVNVQERLNNHKHLLRKNKHANRHLQNAWNKYGESNFKFELLEECEEDFLCSQEHYWCNLLNATNRKFGYNLAETSPDCSNRLTEESISKRTQTRKENAEKRGYWVPEDYRLKLKTTARISPEMRKKQVEKSRRKVIKMDLEGNELQTYDSMAEAAVKNNLFTQGISLACSGKYKQCGGFKWKIFI